MMYENVKYLIWNISRNLEFFNFRGSISDQLPIIGGIVYCVKIEAVLRKKSLRLLSKKLSVYHFCQFSVHKGLLTKVEVCMILKMVLCNMGDDVFKILKWLFYFRF